MKKYILILIITISQLFAISSDIESSFATGIFHENGTGEKIQHKRVTDQNYEGVCFSKIAVLGKIQNKNIQVRIGDSVGYFENIIPIYNVKNIKIGEEITFKHYNVSSGYFEVKIDGKIYDYKVFVK